MYSMIYQHNYFFGLFMCVYVYQRSKGVIQYNISSCNYRYFICLPVEQVCYVYLLKQIFTDGTKVFLSTIHARETTDI